ncbi:MAG: hypothetical protein LAT67_04545 [Balneolales bacterium]|nr:hypothetical protein [Balneolales bacterium]
MILTFSTDNIREITELLGCDYKQIGEVSRFTVKPENNELKTVIEIHMGLKVDGKETNIVSVYSHNSFLQLHNCTGFVASKTLQQITFFGKLGGQTTGLIIEKNGGISMYANVDDTLLNGDFTKLPPEVMMCSVALSLTESLDFEDFSFDDDV